MANNNRKKDKSKSKVKKEDINKAGRFRFYGFSLKKRHLLLLGIFILALAAYIWRHRNNYIAATVNGQPIFTETLDKKLRERFGQSTLDGLIGEKLIQQEAEKRGISATDTEIDEEINKTMQSLPENVNLQQFLSFQGLTEGEFRNQVRIRLMVNKILGDDVQIPDEEIQQYIEDSADIPEATDPAMLENKAKEALKEQKLQEKFQAWYQELLDKADIQRLL